MKQRFDYLIVANPTAGRIRRGFARRRLDLFSKRLDCPVLGLDTKTGAEFHDCLAEAARDCRVLVVAGGDGTFAEAVNSFQGRGPVLAYLPLGSGNALDFALGRACSAPGYFVKVLAGRWSPISLMLVNERRRALLAGLGLDAEALRSRARLARLGRLSLIGYALSLAAAMSSFRPFDLEMTSAGGTGQHTGVLALLAGKHPYYGYGLKVNQGLTLADHRLGVRVVDRPRPAALALLAAGFLSRPGSGGSFFQGDRFEITTSRPVPVHTDGDLLDCGRRFTFRLLPNAVRLIF